MSYYINESSHAHMFVPDHMMPSQLIANAAEQWRGKKGAPALCFALLEQAVEEVKRYRGVDHVRGQRLYGEAWDWLMADDPTWMFSSTSCCEIVGVNPESLRRQLRQWAALPQPPTRERLREIRRQEQQQHCPYKPSVRRMSTYRYYVRKRKMPDRKGWYEIAIEDTHERRVAVVDLVPDEQERPVYDHYRRLSHSERAMDAHLATLETLTWRPLGEGI